MAAGKPVVSTPIRDVVMPYSSIVSIADEAGEFLKACELALAMSPQARGCLASRMAATVAGTSWDRTVARMRELIEAAAAVPRTSLMTTLASDAAAPDAALRAALPQQVQVAIIGAGPTGLSAAYHLGEGSLLLEQNPTVGGWCRSIQDQGFTFDYAGHIMFSNDPYVHQMYAKLLGDNVHWQDREAWIYSKDVYTRYPFQGALHGLPPDVLKECIVGAIEARFGRLKNDTPRNRGVSNSSPSASPR